MYNVKIQEYFSMKNIVILYQRKYHYFYIFKFYSNHVLNYDQVQFYEHLLILCNIISTDFITMFS